MCLECFYCRELTVASLQRPSFWDLLHPGPDTSQCALNDALTIDLFVGQGVLRRLPAYDDLFLRDYPTTNVYCLETSMLLNHPRYRCIRFVRPGSSTNSQFGFEDNDNR